MALLEGLFGWLVREGTSEVLIHSMGRFGMKIWNGLKTAAGSEAGRRVVGFATEKVSEAYQANSLADERVWVDAMSEKENGQFILTDTDLDTLFERLASEDSYIRRTKGPKIPNHQQDKVRRIVAHCDKDGNPDPRKTAFAMKRIATMNKKRWRHFAKIMNLTDPPPLQVAYINFKKGVAHTWAWVKTKRGLSAMTRVEPDDISAAADAKANRKADKKIAELWGTLVTPPPPKHRFMKFMDRLDKGFEKIRKAYREA